MDHPPPRRDRTDHARRLTRRQSDATEQPGFGRAFGASSDAVDAHALNLLSFRDLSSDWGTNVIATRFRLCLLAGALLVGACTGDDTASDVTVAPDQTTAPETTTTDAPTTTTEDPAAAVEQAFFDQWDAFVEILEDPDPSNPLIDEFFAGAARDQVLDIVSRYIAEDKVAARPDDSADFAPSIITTQILGGDSAIVEECTIDGTKIVRRSTGEVLNDNLDVNHFENTFELIDGQWKLTSTKVLKDSCEPA